MRQFRSEGGAAEVSFYVLCAAAAALMLQVDFRAGHPPPIFWLLFLACIVGVVRIFMVAWHEDGRTR